MGRTAIALSLVAGLAAPVAMVAPAQAAHFPRKAVQRAIERQIKEVIGQPADVKCPARSSWTKGAVFYCTAKPTDGAAAYRVKVTLGSAKTHYFKWRQQG